ncbi:MAG: hypothetical protein ABFS08_03060 [Pseudomonadota bacterium]
MDLLSFRIPDQQQPDKDSVDTRIVAVRQWVEELPLGHIGETSRRLYEMLREVNRLDIPLANRFELMEECATPLHTVLESLERHYTGISFPLPKKSLRAAQLSTGILHEVVIAYQAVLNSEENASWFYRMTHTRIWLEAVHRLIYYLNRILCNYRLIHRVVPGGVWLALHQLYWTARDNKRQREKVKLPLTDRPTTTEGEYKRALLLSMIEPQLFNREQMEQVHNNMPMWLERCELVEAEQRSSELSGYCIRRDADAPHSQFNEECCQDCDADKQAGLLLDLSGLNVRIHGLLEQLGESDLMQLPGGGAISRETLETLLSCWHSFESGRDERTRSEVRVEAAIGMSSIFQLLQGRTDSSAHGISDQHMSDELEELVLQGDSEEKATLNPGTVMGGYPEEDVWNSIFHATEITQKSWSQEADEKEYQFTHARQRDYTKSGYCLEFDKGEMEPLQVGELIGVQAGNDEVLHLCMVRWLTDGGSSLSAGLMCLADSMEPVLVVVHQERRRTALYCLLGIGKDHKPQLFLPHLPGIHSKQLYLVIDGKEVPLSLHDRVVVSPLFDGFHFHAVSVDADEEMSLEQMNRQLHGLTHPEREKEMKSGDFSDLWNSL